MRVSARRLTTFLFVSLGLNLFLGGMLTVGGLKHSLCEPTRSPPQPTEMLFRAGEALGPGDHPRLRSLLDQKKPALVAHRQAMRDARVEVRRALETDPLDEPCLTRGLATLRHETTNTQTVLHSSLIEIARGMNIEQRRRLGRITISEKGGWRHRPR